MEMQNVILQAQAGGGNFGFLIMMVVLFAIMYFFMVRPQQKEQKRIQKFREELQPGTQVFTQGGVLGTVRAINKETGIVDLEVANGVKIKVHKNFILSAPSDNNRQGK